MKKQDIIYRIQAAYPRIYHHACHGSHQGTSMPALSQRDASILAHLDRDTPVTQAQLAAHLGIAKSTMSEAVKHLVEQGYVRQETDSDKRTHRLMLTDKGQEAMSACSVLETDKLAVLLSVMSDQELKKALTGLELLAEATLRLALKRGEER